MPLTARASGRISRRSSVLPAPKLMRNFNSSSVETTIPAKAGSWASSWHGESKSAKITRSSAQPSGSTDLVIPMNSPAARIEMSASAHALRTCRRAMEKRASKSTSARPSPGRDPREATKTDEDPDRCQKEHATQSFRRARSALEIPSSSKAPCRARLSARAARCHSSLGGASSRPRASPGK